MLAAFIATLPWTPDLSEIPPRPPIAAICFAVGVADCTSGNIGGDDVKILAALMLFVPPRSMRRLLLVVAACRMLGVALIVRSRSGFADPASRWKFLRNRALPMGISSAGAGLALPVMLLSGA